jgi:hypothetical protein
MATLNFSFDTGSVPLSRIVDAFATAYRYHATIDGQPNPETKAQFARRMVKHYITQIVLTEERKAEEAKIVKFDLDLT